MIPSEEPAAYALDVAKLFTLFFVTLGPMKLLGPLARSTARVRGKCRAAIEAPVVRLAVWVTHLLMPPVIHLTS